MAHGATRDDPIFGDAERPARRRRRGLPLSAWLAVLALIGVAAFSWWYRFGEVDAPRRPPPPPVAEAPAAPEPAPPAAPAVRYPVDATGTPLPPLRGADRFVADALVALLGRRAVQDGVIADGFVHRFVATVDNLARSHAAPSMWPVPRATGRFTVHERDGATVVGVDNDVRYAAFVRLAEQVDMTRALELYRRLYPLFQQAYEEQGYPGRHFNDRLVQVIDHLLQAPEPPQPVEVALVEVRGPVPAASPWLRYEFADPELQALSAGQKLMVRIGPVNARRLKARLAEARAGLVNLGPGAGVPAR